MAWNDPSHIPPMQCLICILERKGAELLQPAAPLPAPRAAVTLINSAHGPVTPVCYEHIEVQRHSPLAVPLGTQIGRSG